MVIDPYKNPAVVKRMNELQQRKYRQGHRNASDTRGNPAYVLTEDDKISCLDPAMQQIVRSEKAKIQKLQDYAEPFTLAIGIGESPPSYVVNITHPSYGHARRSGAASHIDSMKNPDAWFRQQIDSMKAELGYALSPLQGPIDEKLKQKKERGFSVTDKRSKTPAAPLHCPDHGNELVRGSEVDTLICTVVGCKKVARKKNRAKSFVKEPATTEQTKAEETSDVADVMDMAQLKETFANLVLDVETPASTMASIQNILKSVKSTGPFRYPNTSFPSQSVYTANSNFPKLVEENGRFYLVQEVSSGRVAYIDITMTGHDFKVMRSSPGGYTETELRMSGVRPS